MTRIRSALVVLAVSGVMLVPAVDVFARGGGRGGGGGGMQPPPVPQKQPNPTLVSDRQLVASSQADFDKAKAAYNAKLADLQKDYKKQPGYADVKKALDEAQKTLDEARTALLEKLKKDNAEYKAAVAKEAAAAKKMEQIRAANGTRDQVSAAAKAKFDAGDEVEKLEKAALDTDKPCNDAKKALADAKTAMDDQDKKMADALAPDDALKTLKQTMTDKQTALDEAKKKLQTDTATLPAMI